MAFAHETIKVIWQMGDGAASPPKFCQLMTPLWQFGPL